MAVAYCDEFAGARIVSCMAAVENNVTIKFNIHRFVQLSSCSMPSRLSYSLTKSLPNHDWFSSMLEFGNTADITSAGHHSAFRWLATWLHGYICTCSVIITIWLIQN